MVAHDGEERFHEYHEYPLPLEFELVDSHLEASSMSSRSRLVVVTGGLWCELERVRHHLRKKFPPSD